MKQISVIVPVFNEEKIIRSSLLQIFKFFHKNNYDFEIIVIDDGSIDKSVLEIKKIVSDKIFLIENKKNLGKGASIKKGVAQATKDWILFTDADLSTPIGELSKFFVQDQVFDILIGSRKIKNSLIEKHQPKWKQVSGQLGNFYINIFLHLNISDTQCGFKLFHCKTKKLFEKAKINRWGLDFELLFLAKKHNFKIKEVPIVWKNNFDSKVKKTDYFKTLWEVFMVRWNYLTGKYN